MELNLLNLPSHRFWLNMTELNIPSITITDVMDILIASYLIYNLTLWIKETRAWALFKGIVVVFVFGVAAVFLKLNTILWIMQNTLSVALLAIIIIFQPELRKALEQIGKGKFVSPLTPFIFAAGRAIEDKCSVDTFRQIMEAASVMSSKKTGALILLEKDVPLGDFERTGIAIDAIVTSQILINIFEHNTPLHDGALIIKNNRISAASCFLPLTESKLSMELGTRHRAAVGASELSDCFVIVVSEETGDISVATGGKIHRKKTVDEIEAMFFGDRKIDSNE